ncbi:glycoside hydrolase family 16 protein [Meredithblackwellia eburnea MCA 4105]
MLVSPTVLATIALLPSTGFAWSLKKEYKGSTFFNDWNFINSPDSTTHGLVQYVDRATAQSNNLAYVTSGGKAIIAVDDTLNTGLNGLRNSVRIESKDTFGVESIFIADFSHVPYGCGAWPAFWAFGPNWPNNGEIDIFETVNLQPNQATLHTGPGCSHDPSGVQTGQTLQQDCAATATNNNGCGVLDSNPNSSGPGFASSGGAVFVMSLTAHGLAYWRFPRGSIPADITNQNLNPQKWGTPIGRWKWTTCQPSSHFNNLALTFDITVCGDWAGQADVWGQSSCAAQYSTCAAAAQQGSNFANAFFEINYVRVHLFQELILSLST